ncbi:MAG: hypothetical protein HQ534_01800 [Armatimonadetes bacterium]|nr:hypothetical protein [Armatimonadota bacterium]
MTKTKYGILLVIILMTLMSSKIQGQIAVVVAKNNPVNNLTLEELRRIYLGKVTTFSNGEKIILLQYEPLMKEFYRIVLNKTPMKVRKHWIGVVFSGGSATPPREFTTIHQLSEILDKYSGVIGFIDWEDVGDNEKVITIDGIRPQEANYPLQKE